MVMNADWTIVAAILSLSPQAISGLLPPSSSASGLTCAAAPAINFWPTSVEPVNVILRQSGPMCQPLSMPPITALIAMRGPHSISLRLISRAAERLNFLASILAERPSRVSGFLGLIWARKNGTR